MHFCSRQYVIAPLPSLAANEHAPSSKADAQVQQNTHDETTQKRKQIVSEAVSAITETGNALKALDEGIDGFESSGAMKERVAANLKRIKEIEALLIDTPDEPPLLHPSMALHYRNQIGKLIARFRKEEHRDEVAQVLRSLVEKIVIHPGEGDNGISVDLFGDLAGILSVATGKDRGSEEIEAIAVQVQSVYSFGNAEEMKNQTGGNPGEYSAYSREMYGADYPSPMISLREKNGAVERI